MSNKLVSWIETGIIRQGVCLTEVLCEDGRDYVLIDNQKVFLDSNAGVVVKMINDKLDPFTEEEIRVILKMSKAYNIHFVLDGNGFSSIPQGWRIEKNKAGIRCGFMDGEEWCEYCDPNNIHELKTSLKELWKHL